MLRHTAKHLAQAILVLLGVVVLIFALGFKRGITDFVGELYNALTKKRVQS